MSNAKSSSDTPASQRKLYSNSRMFTPRQKKRQRSEIRKSQCTLTGNQITKDLVIEAEDKKRRPGPSHHTPSASVDQIPLSPTASFSNSTINTSIRTSNTYYNVSYLDYHSIFPYSNKGYEHQQKTLAEESKQWEALFDHQYTFGSFQYGIAKPLKQYFYQGNWPLDAQDIGDATPSMARRKMLQIKSSESNLSPRAPYNNQSNTSFFTLPSPTIPSREVLESHIQLFSQNDHLNNSGSNGQIAILPCPSSTSFPKYKSVENEKLWKERLEMLRKIQEEGFSMEMNGTQSDPYKQSGKAIRLHKQLMKTATKIKSEVLVEMRPANELEKDEFEVCPEAQTPETAPSNRFSLSIPLSHPIEPQDSSSLISLDNEKKDDFETEEPFETRRKNRTSFLLFAFGFLFPPLWVVGTFYNPSSAIPRTAESKTIDQKWKKCSRNSLFVMLLGLSASFVLVATIKPKILGFRNSNEKSYHADRVVFDTRELD